MNTADRALAMVDYALRRRFAFFELTPQFASDKFTSHLTKQGADPSLIAKIQNKMARLNSTIAQAHRELGPGFCIGHSYFCVPPGMHPDSAWYSAVVQHEVAPLIREYFLDADEAQLVLSELLT
jgi:5-methylcytosine-specific restriction enzyme B